MDGLNLYHGTIDARLLKSRWLDVHQMCQLLANDAGGKIGASIDVASVAYCTSMVTASQARKHQDTYHEMRPATNP